MEESQNDRQMREWGLRLVEIHTDNLDVCDAGDKRSNAPDHSHATGVASENLAAYSTIVIRRS